MADQPRHRGLLALSSAAILAVYTAGYVRTKPAADRIAAIEARRPVEPAATVEYPPESQTAAPQPRVVRPPDEAPPPAVRRAVPATPREATPETSIPELSAAPAAPPIDAPPEPSEPTVVAVQPPEPEAPVVESAPPEPPPAPTPIIRQGEYRDGTYFGWGYSRHGNIQVAVVVEEGRVASAEISQCRTRYSCSVVDRLPQQVLSRQRARVDVVSGATESTYAYEDAVAEALAKAK